MHQHLSLKVTTSGVRGIIGESLSPQILTSFAAAFGTYCGTGPIVIASDTRPSRELVRHAVLAGLLSVGCTPVDLGIAPAPTLMHYVRTRHAFGGICLSGSHNPIEWNALKFIGSDGMVLPPNKTAELVDLFHQGAFPRVSAWELSRVKLEQQAVADHLQAVRRAVQEDRIRSRGFRVAVDCCNGAASLAAPQFLQDLGCTVLPLYTDPHRPFPRSPEPLPAHLSALGALVREQQADFGFALDADADRLAVVGSDGQPLGEDATIALAVRHVLRKDSGPVVVDMACSRIVEDIAAGFGVPVYRTRVGEIHVVERMRQCGARIGGEGNGGVIAPEINPCRDSFVAMALLLEALATEGGTVDAMRSRFPRYALLKEKLDFLAREIPTALRRLQNFFRKETVDRTDGIKIVWPDRWLLARASSTEPVVRVIAEAPTEKEARQLMQQAFECLRPSL